MRLYFIVSYASQLIWLLDLVWGGGAVVSAGQLTPLPARRKWYVAKLNATLLNTNGGR